MEKLTSARRFAWLLLAAALCAPAGWASEASEYAVKAAYLYKFGLFVQWPSSAFASPSSPVNLCVLGDDPFGKALDDAVSGQRIGTHAIVVQRLKAPPRGASCQILYLSPEFPNRAQVLDSLSGNGVLTVTDGPKQGGQGVIHFVLKDARVRFDIDDEQAARDGLAISSKLLSLALNVKPRH
jgi:hypothetical protein